MRRLHAAKSDRYSANFVGSVSLRIFFWLRQKLRHFVPRPSYDGKMLVIEPQGSRATRLRPKQKAIPFGMTFCFGGDKRDRTADLMTASHALSK